MEELRNKSLTAYLFEEPCRSSTHQQSALSSSSFFLFSISFFVLLERLSGELCMRKQV